MKNEAIAVDVVEAKQVEEFEVESTKGGSSKAAGLWKNFYLITLAILIIVSGGAHTLFAQPFKKSLGGRELSVPWFFSKPIVTFKFCLRDHMPNCE